MSWYKDINAILKQEPETWLAYIYGQQLENLPHLIRRKPRVRGLLLRTGAFGLFLIRHFRLTQREKLKGRADYLFFSGTANQMSSLNGAATYLTDHGARVIEISQKQLLKNDKLRSRYKSVDYTFTDVLKSLILFVCRGPSLYTSLKKKNAASINNYFNSFCSVYAHLVYFHRVLQLVSPSFVVTANDHSPSNRSLLAVAHYLGIKTVYVQHASVSSIFPALRVDYAFLDGQCAVDIYKRCESNQPSTLREMPIPKIVLSGQKKKITRTKIKKESVVGVALNALDDTELAVRLIEDLIGLGLELKVRWHPGQPKADIKKYVSILGGRSKVQLSNPENESISDFMASIRWLVAGNSSIHLEAALAGVLPIYYEQSPSDKPDYYGYVKHGLSMCATSPRQIVEIVSKNIEGGAPDVEAVRYYSSTYCTEWEGREDELAAISLMDLAKGKCPPVKLSSL